jgi:putative acetyltransferase
LAFGQPAEADLVEKLRWACTESLSLVAEDDEVVMGHILFTPVVVAGAGSESSGWDSVRWPCCRITSVRASARSS